MVFYSYNNLFVFLLKVLFPYYILLLLESLFYWFTIKVQVTLNKGFPIMIVKTEDRKETKLNRNTVYN